MEGSRLSTGSALQNILRIAYKKSSTVQNNADLNKKMFDKMIKSHKFWNSYLVSRDL